MSKMQPSPGVIVRAAIYARVSSEHQAQEQTIASQLAALRERVAAEGFSLDDELCFVDDGVSGTTLQRPALERLRDAAYAGGFQKLYVHSPDRLARRYAYQVLLVEELRRHGVELVFLNRAIGVSPEEDLLLQMQGMFAEYERAKILERSRRGKRHAAQRGAVNVLSGAPYGYRYITKHTGGGTASYEVVPEQAAVVRQLFEWVGRDRLSIGEVCRRLKGQGTPSPKGKAWWDRTSIWTMLKNPAYIGRAAFGKTRVGERRRGLRHHRGQAKTPRRTFSTYDTKACEQLSIPVPALVSDEIFAAVQEQLAANRHRGRQRKRGARYLLQGLLECGCCGYAYYGKKVSRSSVKGKVPYAYYRCVGTDAYRFGGQRVCQNHQVRTDRLDDAVWSDVQQLLRDPNILRQEYERRLQSPADDPSRREPTARQAQQAQRAISRLIDAFAEGLLDKQEFEPRLAQARQRAERLHGELDRLAAQDAEREQLRQSLRCLDDFASHIREGLDHVDWLTRREIIRTLVERVRVEPEQVRVTYRISLPLFAITASKERLLHFRWRSHHAALRGSGVWVAHAPVLHHTRLQPFTDQAQQHTVTHPKLEKRPQVAMIQMIKELPDVHLQDPASPTALHLVSEGLQRLVRRSSAAEAVRAVQEVLFVEWLQQHDDRPLENLVLQGRDSERASLGGRAAFRNVHSSHGRSAVRAGLRAVEQALEIALQVALVFFRGHSVHAHGAVLARALVRFLQPIKVHQVGQRSERHLRRLFRQLCYPFLFRRHDGRISRHSSCFPKRFHDPTPRFPPLAPVGDRSPASAVLSRRYDILPSVPPRFVVLRLAVPRVSLVRFAPRRTSVPPWPGVDHPVSPSGNFTRRRLDLPSSWGTPIVRLRMFFRRRQDCVHQTIAVRQRGPWYVHSKGSHERSFDAQ
jgi:site-specific DNA recombinase